MWPASGDLSLPLASPVALRSGVVNDKQMIRLRLIPLLFLGCALLSTGETAADEGNTFFRERIEPLLEEHCLACHSHAAGEMENGLTLDSQAGWEEGGDSGPAVVPGKPDASLLIRAVRSADPTLQMPPDDPLSDEAVALLEEWVRRGAPDPRRQKPVKSRHDDWWSLQNLQRPEVPARTESPAENPIDAFIDSRLEGNGLRALEQADRRTLIRRLYDDLHGLPPTPEQVRRFLNDSAPDAWEKLVDEVLESPRYGERWARHWLDVIHFADSHGCEHDVKRDNAWRFRDYVVDRLNADVRWARFIREQLAADVFFPQEPQLTAALGFIGAGPLELSRARTAPVTFDYLDRDDMVAQTMSAFVSTTANCARCHAHKFDPVSQEDYYALQAVFAGIGKGDVEYDISAETAQQRRHWTSMLKSAENPEPPLLQAEGVAAAVIAWESGVGRKEVAWQVLRPETFVSASGAVLSLQEDGSLLAEGERPETDTYMVTAVPGTDAISALRLDVLPDDRLPMKGPGRQDNGNLHLSEIQLLLFAPGAVAGQELPIASAEADWNQTGWTIDHAVDGDITTAWGIHPRVGEAHQAVFRLAEPTDVPPGSRLTVILKQQHGTGHLLGRLRLMTTDADPQSVRALPVDVARALQQSAASRDEAAQLAVAGWVMQNIAKKKLQELPSQETVYGASAFWSRADKLSAAQTPKVVHLLRRGNIEQPVREVQPGALSGVQQLPGRFELEQATSEADRRAALANWIAAPENPLTWRSIVNRVWSFHFGRGLCDTPNDLGRMGSQPSHPQLLDWLAVWFRDDANGSLKQLHRLILTSQAWKRRSSSVSGQTSGGDDADSDNRLLWRMDRRRLDAEAVRDGILQISGRLDLTMGGPGVEQFTRHKGQQLTPRLDYGEFDWTSEAARRRSIYRVVWRGIPDPFMEAMDFPDLGLLHARRGVSVSALQSLALYNNEFVLHGSEWLAERLQGEESRVEDQVVRAVWLAWLRAPAESELVLLRDYAETHGLAAVCRVLLNSNEFLFVD